MSPTAPMLPGSEPFSHDAGRVGVLFSHGFPATPQSMVPWAQHLAAQGHSVRVPLLAGFGRTWRELNATRWPDWMATLEEAYGELQQRCDRVYVCGLSMGGLLVTRLAINHPEIAGLCLVNPMFRHNNPTFRLLPILRLFLPYLPGIAGDIKRPGVEEVGLPQMPLPALYSTTQLMKQVGQELPRMTQPVQVFRSVEDHVIPRISVDYFKERVGSTQVEEFWLQNSYHVATLDNDAPFIFEQSADFIQRVEQAAAAGRDDAPVPSPRGARQEAGSHPSHPPVPHQTTGQWSPPLAAPHRTAAQE